MSTRILIPAFLSLAVLACSDDGSGPATQSKSSFIVGGQPEAGYAAVGALVSDGEAFCTGTLIEPRVVVTAAHCLDGARADQVSYFVGADATQLGSGTLLRASRLVQHPEWRGGDDDPDIGVVVLAQAAQVEPVALNTAALRNDVVGRSPLFVGYGITRGNRDDAGVKRSVRIRVDQIMAGAFSYSQPGKNTCNGDSGGPALLEMDGVTKLIGVTSYGDEDCTEYGVDARVDVHAAFIRRASRADGGGDGDGEGEGDGADELDQGEDGDFDDEDDEDDEDDGDFEDEGDLEDHDEGDFEDEGEDDDSCEDGHEGEEGEDGDFEDDEEWGHEGEDGDFEDDEEWGDEGDICEEEGWYDDGVCDEVCAQPDPDCE